MSAKNKKKSKTIKIDSANVTAVLKAHALEDGRNLGDALEAAKAEQARLIAQANSFMASNELAILVAQTKGKRPSARIVLDAAGEASLQFVRREAGKDKSKGASLADLRAKAKSMGIDPAPFGRQKSKLEEAIKQASAGSAPAGKKKNAA